VFYTKSYYNIGCYNIQTRAKPEERQMESDSFRRDFKIQPAPERKKKKVFMVFFKSCNPSKLKE